MVSPGDVAIFWDYENCRPPSSLSGYLIADRIRRIASPYGSIKLFKAYTELNSDLSARSYALQSELQSSGVSLTHCPHNGKKDVADKMLIVDMLAFAIDHCTPTTFVLISGDRDYAYAASILRLRGYEVVIVLPSAVSHVSLQMQASILFEWEKDVLENRQSSHSSKEDASAQAECSSGAVSPEMATASPPNIITASNNISDAFVPAAPSLAHSWQPSSTTLQSTSSGTNENNVDMLGGLLFPDPMRRCASTVRPLEVSIDQQTSFRDLVEERPPNDIELVQSGSHLPTYDVNVVGMEAEGYEHVPYFSQPDQAGHSEGTDGSPHDGNGALRSLPSLSEVNSPPLISSLRSATQTDTTTGINIITADLTGMGMPDVLLRETCSDAIIADTSSREFSGGSRNAPHPTSSPPLPFSSCSQEETLIVEDLTSKGGTEVSLGQLASTAPCESPIQATLSPHATVFEYNFQKSSLSPASTRSATSSTNLGTNSLNHGYDERFSALVECFQTKSAVSGTRSIYSTELGSLLLRRDPHAYKLAGVRRLKDYIDLARSLGIVVSPGLDKNGIAWIEINPLLYTSNPSN